MKEQKGISRRGFFKTSLGTMAGVAALACGITPRQGEGPFYPIQDQADKDNDLTLVKGRIRKALGEVVHVQGQVLDEDCQPVQGALVEIWQACETGKYNHPGDPNTAKLDPNFQYWGRDVSGESGMYSFKTIIPGNYPASPGWIRPAHIHFKVQRRGFHELTTQMYFEGNPYNGTDRVLMSIPRHLRSNVIVKFEDQEDGVKLGKFNINLKSVQ